MSSIFCSPLVNSVFSHFLIYVSVQESHGWSSTEWTNAVAMYSNVTTNSKHGMSLYDNVFSQNIQSVFTCYWMMLWIGNLRHIKIQIYKNNGRFQHIGGVLAVS